MTVVDQVTFDALDDPSQHTENVEALLKQRGTQDERRLIPKGMYESTLLESTLVRRRDGGGFVVRMIARTDRLGVYLTSWRGLSGSPTDPYDLTDNQVKSLRKFAESMGIPVPAPAVVIVRAVGAMVGGPIMARVSHGPAGIQSVFSREEAASSSMTLRVGGQLMIVDAQGEAQEITEQRAQAAFDAHQNVVVGRRAARAGFITAAKGCHDLRESQGWLALGFESMLEYLAQPDVELSRSEFYGLADIWQSYVLDGGAAPELLSGAERSKLEVPLPALKQGLVDAERAAADAESMTRRDLREHYRALLGDGEEAPVDGGRVNDGEQESRQRDQDEPVERDDSWQPIVDDPDKGPFDAGDLVRWAESYGHPEEWAKKAQDLHGKVETRDREIRDLKAELDARPHQTDLTHHTLAQGLAMVLARVMREVGDPRQKRMGKELRAAVVAALDEAREQGLEVD